MMGKMEIRSPPGSRPRDGRHCDLCGCSQPAVRCDKCGCQIFCLSCDDMYHRHPKRRFHLRKAVDPISTVQQARPVLPMKISQLNATNPADPSKMPLPPPRKKKSLFSSFRKPSSENNSPPLPKKEYSWTDRLGSIKKFMSNRPLPPLPGPDDSDPDSPPTTNGQMQRGDLSFIHKRSDERPPQLPQRSPRSPDFPGMNQEKERIPSIPPHLPGQIRNGSLEPNANHMNQNHQFNSNDPNHWNNHTNHQNDGQAFGTLNRQRPFMPPGASGYPGGMHQSSSATDLHNLQNPEGMHGPVPPHYPHYPVNPHMPPHYPYPVYPGYPNYPQYFGNSFANLSNPPTSEGDFSDSETSSRHSSKRHAFRKRAKRSQSVMMDRMAYPGQFFPFGAYPGYPWGGPMPMEAPPSPASSVRSLNRAGRARRRKKGTSEDDDEELSETSSPMSRPKSSSSDPKEHPRAPLATQTTSSEYESDDDAAKRRNKINTIKRPPEPPRSPSPAVNRKVAKLKKSSSKQSDSDTPESPAVRNDRRHSDSNTDQRQPVLQSSAQQQPVRQSPVHQQHITQRSPTPPQQPVMRESPVAPSTSAQAQTYNSVSSETWECRHCTYINPIGNKICQVCCKTATPRTETPVSGQSRPPSTSAKHRKESAGSEEYFIPDEITENEASKKDKQEMANLNSALDEAEKQISRGLEELMKLKDDIDSSASKEKTKPAETQSLTDSEGKPVYKSSGRMRTSILDKLKFNKSQTTNSSVSTSTETQTDQNNRTVDKIIMARRLSNSSSASETYNSPLAQSPELEREYLGSKQKRDSSCQTQQDSIADYLEKRKTAEESFLGRPINNFGFGYGDRMDMVTSPVPSMYDRFYGGGGYGGMMQRSHSRASLYTGRVNDFGPMDYGPGPGFGYGPAPMYRSVSRGSLTSDYPDGRQSGFHNIRKPDFYLSMEELVERRCQDNINNIRAQGLELVRMIREAEQQGFNADDIQVALTHCGKQNPLEWLQENWRNMVDSVVTLSTNYGNDKKENDIGLLSENEARDALRLHKGNIWAAVTECVEGRQRKYLEVNARGNFPRQDIVDALTASDGDVEMAYAKLTKSTGKPFLMRIWGQGEGAQNQDGAQPMMHEDFRDGPHRYLKDDTLNNDDLSDDLWSEDEEAVEWDDDDDYEEERGDIEDLRTCQEDLPSNVQEVTTPESERSDYCDAFSVDDRNMSSPSDDVFFVIPPEAKPEKKKGFLSKLVALRRDSKERAGPSGKEEVLSQQDNQSREDSISEKITNYSEQKNGGALNTLKNKFSAIKDSVTGGIKNDKKFPTAQLDRRTIIVRGQLEHESLSTKEERKSSPTNDSLAENTSKIPTSDSQNKEQINYNEEFPINEATKSTKGNKTSTLILSENDQMKTEKGYIENESKQTDSKKAENKNSQSLAERLKLAKQTRVPFDAPGPSGIKKESLIQPAVTKRDTPTQPTNEMSLRTDANLTSKLIPEKERTTDKTNFDTIQSFQNLERCESTEKSISVNQNNHQATENIDNVESLKLNATQNTEILEAERIPHVSIRDQLKKSNDITSTKSPKIDTFTNKTLNPNISETKKESSLKPQITYASDNQPTIKSTTKINSENALKSKTSIAKNKENKPSSLLESKNDDNHSRISEVSKEDIVSKVDIPTANVSGKNTPTGLKIADSQKDKPENTISLTKDFSPEVSISENKTSLIKRRDETDHNKQEDENTKVNSEKPKSIKEDNKIIQQIENKNANIETSAKTTSLPKSVENSKNLESSGNQKAAEKYQNSLQEVNKSEVKISTKEEKIATENKENSSKNLDSTKNIPRESPITNDFHQRNMSDKVPKPNEIRKTATTQKIFKSDETNTTAASHGIPKTQSDNLPDHTMHKVDVLIKSEEAVADSAVIKNIKETEIVGLSKHDIQNNLEKSGALSENKSTSQGNKTLQDLASSSNAVIENPLTQAISEKSSDGVEPYHNVSKIKSLSGEASSKPLISNQTNVIQNLDIVNKENSLTNTEFVKNLPQTSAQDIEVAQVKDIHFSSAQNIESVSESSHSVTESKKENKDDASMISSDNNKGLVVNTENEKSKPTEKNKDVSITAITEGVAANLLSSISPLTNLEPTSDNSKAANINNLENKAKMLHIDSNERYKKEIPVNENALNENETPVIADSINKSSELELKISEIKEVVATEEESKIIPANTILETALHASPEAIQNTFVSIENQNELQSVTTPSTSIDTKVPSNDHEKTEQLEIQTNSANEASTSANLSSSEIINNDASNGVKLQAPVLSKEFPDKNTVEAPVLSNNSEKITVPVSSETMNSESLPTVLNTNTSDNLNLNTIPSSTNASDTDKTSKTLSTTHNLQTTPSSSKNITNNSENIVDLATTISTVDFSDSKVDAVATEISIVEDNSLNLKVAKSSKTEQNSLNSNIDNSSVIEKIEAIAKAANDSINKILPNTVNSTDATTAGPSNASISDSAKPIPSASSMTDTDNIKLKEQSISKLSSTSSDTKSLSNDAKSSTPKLIEQHSKAPEIIAANSSTSSSITNSSSTHAVTSVQSKIFQRTMSEDSKESSESESEDTDIEFSDNSRESSRRGSMLLPSPVDALRSRFEGLASGATIRGGPIRPASPFRRMSFNSRKQVIALERKKDTSADKSWYHKIDPEPVKIVPPKRSVKQQLEMERKVRKMVADRKCRTYKKAEIVVQLMEMNFEEEESIQAANECSTLELAISYLQQECQLCAGHFSVSQIISMTHCEHRACRECIRAYFTVQIRDRTILDLLCPFCNEPDIGDEDVAQDYFNHLDIMLKKLVDTEIHELFQRKLRDRVLMKDPNFRWCSQCSSGFIAMPNLKRLICPDCNAVTCASCRRLWEREHQGISCEAFAALKDATDPEAQAAGLAKMLTEDGISCPSCHFRYALAKGGCMHFRCIQCQHDFCSGCSRPFKMGQKCGVSEFCAKLGLHAHHPRNCLFYLRDKEPEDLQKLLDIYEVKYDRESPEGMEIKSTCQVMEQKETADGMMDDHCGKDVQDGYAGLCRVHYVEYLGQLVNKHKVDPIQIFDNDDLELVLKRANIRLPPKRYRENDLQYREKLIKVIQEELPLDRMDGS